MAKEKRKYDWLLCLLLAIIATLIIIIGVNLFGGILLRSSENSERFDININTEILEKQINEIFAKKFKIVSTTYKSIDELEKERTGAYVIDNPYYEFIAYNEEDNVSFMGFAWGDPGDNINNYKMTINNDKEYEIAKAIISKIKNKKNNKYYVIEGIEYRDYNHIENTDGESYWWRIYTYKKNNMSRNFWSLEGYIGIDYINSELYTF